MASGVVAESPAPSASPVSAGYTRAVVAQVGLHAPEFLDLLLERYTLEPGASSPPTRRTGTLTGSVEAGSLDVTAIDGDVWFAAPDDTEGGSIPTGETRTLRAGYQLVSDGALSIWTNRGTETVILVVAHVIGPGDDAEVVVDLATSPEPTPRRKIVQQITITGPGSGGARYRARIVDRSGRVVGARIPTARELRFVADHDTSAPGVGPAADLPGTQIQELLVRWVGGVCGPHVTFDVSKAFDAIHIIERSPGCDAAAMGHAIVLRIAGRFFLEPGDIEATQERRYPR